MPKMYCLESVVPGHHIFIYGYTDTIIALYSEGMKIILTTFGIRLAQLTLMMRCVSG